MKTDEPYIPGLQPPKGWVFEYFMTGEDPQTETGRYAYWTECFSSEKPKPHRYVRNIQPVFLEAR